MALCFSGRMHGPSQGWPGHRQLETGVCQSGDPEGRRHQQCFLRSGWITGMRRSDATAMPASPSCRPGKIHRGGAREFAGGAGGADRAGNLRGGFPGVRQSQPAGRSPWFWCSIRPCIVLVDTGKHSTWIADPTQKLASIRLQVGKFEQTIVLPAGGEAGRSCASERRTLNSER